MDQSAIQQIQTMGSADSFIAHLKEAGTEFPLAALPENYSLHSLEGFMSQRNQYRGTMSTKNIAEFSKYALQYEQEGTQCFINVDDMAATTVFDLGTQDKPGHCKHRALLTLDKTADFKALLSITDNRLNQKQVAEWVEDFEPYLQVFTSDGELIEISKVSAAIRHMKFERKQGRESEVQDFSARQSEYDAIAVRTTDELPMPAVFKFTCVPYMGLSERTFEMRMSTIGNETLILRIKKFEQHEEEMGEEFKELVVNTLTEGKAKHIETYIGTFKS